MNINKEIMVPSLAPRSFAPLLATVLAFAFHSLPTALAQPADVAYSAAVRSWMVLCEVTPPEPAPVSETVQVQPENEPMSEKIKIGIGGRSFTATLDDNPTAAKLRTMLPLKLRMSELNGNEKYFHLADRLPTDASNPGTIRTGDLMLYGADSLVLFYKTFPNTYSYTRLGRIDDPAGLAAAVGTGDVNVSFESK